MTLIEAAKQAREAFEWNFNTDLDNIPACERWAKMLKENITALNQAIAEAEQQEPVAWITKNGKGWLRWHSPEDSEKNKDSIPLYTTPPKREWQGLTDEEIDTWNIVGHESLREFVRAIEAKLKEKNT